MKKNKFILTGASLSSENKGINALTIGSIIALIKNNPGCEIEIFNQNSSEDGSKIHTIIIDNKTYNITEYYVWSSKFILCGILHIIFFFIPARIKKILFIDNLKYLLFLCIIIKPNWKNKKIDYTNSLLNKLITADYIINLAEGDSFSDIYGLHVFLRHSLDKFLAISYSIPVIIFPQTIGPFKGKIAKFITMIILKKSEKIYIRENESKKHIVELFGNLPNIENSNDMAFLMEPEKVLDDDFENFIKTGIPVGINISGFLYENPIGKEKVLGNSTDYPKITDAIIKTLLNLDSKIKIIFFSHVGAEDYPISNIIYNKYLELEYNDRFFLLDKNYSAPQIKYLLSKLTFFTGARMHACIGALSTGVTTVPQAYSYKFKGIMEKLGLEEYVIDLKTDNIENVKNLINNAYTNRLEITQKISISLNNIQKEALKCGIIDIPKM